MPGGDYEKFANLRLLFGHMFGHPGKKLLLPAASSRSGASGTLRRRSTGTSRSGCRTTACSA